MGNNKEGSMAILDSPVDDTFKLESKALLKNVRDAIRVKGANWQAEENSVLNLPPEVRMGLLSPTPFSPVLPPSPVHLPLPLPLKFNWNNVDGVDYVTPAKFQGDGTCAAHASTDALESCVLRTGLSHEPNLDLAEHAIIGTIGGGGNLHAIAAFMQSTGLPLDSLYPGDSSTAKPGWQSQTYHLANWDCLYPYIVEQVKLFILVYGPVVTTMNCPPDFWGYHSGVYTNIYGLPGGFHAILVIGYDDTEHCFIIKNNWGKDWGQDGFGKIHYCEFRSSQVNLGWDIHTYIRAEKPSPVTYVTVPVVVGMRPHTAETIITSAGLTCRTVGVTNSPNSRVFSQNPTGGRKVSAGTLVTVRCNTNPVP